VKRVYYGWRIALAAFLNLFFAVGILYYGFPVFYPALVNGLGFTRAQTTQGFLLGFVFVGLLFGLVAGALIDRLGPGQVIRWGIGFLGLSLVLMGRMSHLWQYYLLCVVEVVGYTLAGPIPNQVLVSRWFQAKRGRVMGYAYLGLGMGGVISAPLINTLINRVGWRGAFEILGVAMLVILFPVAQWVTRSSPSELGLNPDGLSSVAELGQPAAQQDVGVRRALRTRNFWLILVGCTLVIGAIGTVIQHLILLLQDQGYSIGYASHVMSALLMASLVGRVIAGYCADCFRKKNVMASFYLLAGLCVPLLFLARRPAAVWGFAVLFGLAMGADYMLIPLVTAECFGISGLGKLLALIIMGYSVGQWTGPVLAGRIFDATRSYDAAWATMTVAGVLGAATIYTISPRSHVTPAISPPSHVTPPKAGVHCRQGGFPPSRE
jgi:MFS family permease